jgi:VWFA-related protein
MRRRLQFVGIVFTLLVLAAPGVIDAQRGGGGGGGGFGGGGGGGGRGGAGPTGQLPGGRGAQPPDDRQRQPEQDQTPTFRSSVLLVQIDAIVTDASGKPVTGLTADDFEVLEQGHPRDITTFAAVDIPVIPATEEALPRVESDTTANTGPPGRTYLIALDETAPDRALRAREILRRFVERYMGPNDLAAVALTGRGLSTSGQDFTSNKRLILQAIDKFSGGIPGYDAPAIQSSDGRQLASSLRKLTEFLATMPGRKVLIYIGESLGGIDPYGATAYHGTSLSPAEYDAHAAIAAATRGNVTIYPIDPRGATTETTAAESFDTSSLDARADLAAIADVTGGFALTSSNNYMTAFERLVRENSSYYTIGFASDHDKRDGRFVGVQVKAKRPGLIVRARSGYVAPLGKERPVEVVTGDARLPTVAAALSSPVGVNDLGMRVTAAAYRGKAKNAAIALVIEFDASKLELVEKNGIMTADLEVSYLATDAKGKVKPGKRQAGSIGIKKELMPQTLHTGVRLVTKFELPEGRYQLRIALGSIARAGSVVYDLEVPDFSAGALTMSNVLLTSTTAQIVVNSKLGEVVATGLPTPPVATRDFARQETLSVYAEVYENGKRAGSTPPPLVVELRDPSGKVVRTATQQKTSTPVSGDDKALAITSSMPLSELEAGPYVLHLQTRTADGDHTAQREIPVRLW